MTDIKRTRRLTRMLKIISDYSFIENDVTTKGIQKCHDKVEVWKDLNEIVNSDKDHQ